MVHLCKNYHFQNEANSQTFLVKRCSVWNDLPAKSIQQSDIAARKDTCIMYKNYTTHAVPR